MLLAVPTAKTLLKYFMKKTNQTKFVIEKVIIRKGYRLHLKWKGYDNSFNSWINMKDIV